MTRPLPRGARIDLEQHGEGPSAKPLARVRRQHRSAAECDHGRVGRSEHGRGDGRLDLPEAGLAVAGEELVDRGAGAPLDLMVEVDELPAQPARDLLAERRLARTHEACEREMAVQGVRGHRMRSR